MHTQKCTQRVTVTKQVILLYYKNKCLLHKAPKNFFKQDTILCSLEVIH